MDNYKKKDIKKFLDIESPNRLKSFKERTGEVFELKVRHKIVDLGSGYGTTEPLKDEQSQQSN